VLSRYDDPGLVTSAFLLALRLGSKSSRGTFLHLLSRSCYKLYAHSIFFIKVDIVDLRKIARS